MEEEGVIERHRFMSPGKEQEEQESLKGREPSCQARELSHNRKFMAMSPGSVQGRNSVTWRGEENRNKGRRRKGREEGRKEEKVKGEGRNDTKKVWKTEWRRAGGRGKHTLCEVRSH